MTSFQEILAVMFCSAYYIVLGMALYTAFQMYRRDKKIPVTVVVRYGNVYRSGQKLKGLN